MTNQHSDTNGKSLSVASEQLPTTAGVVVGSNRILRMKEVQKEIGLSRAIIYNMINDGRFPRGRRIGARCTGWPASEIEAEKSVPNRLIPEASS